MGELEAKRDALKKRDLERRSRSRGLQQVTVADALAALRAAATGQGDARTIRRALLETLAAIGDLDSEEEAAARRSSLLALWA